ncbi:MAG: hypothetical protein ACLPLP_12470 [Mycobacterium sp.]
MPDLVAAIRQIIENHRATGQLDDPEVSCGCGTEGLRDHPRHVAEQTVDELGLIPEKIDEVTKQIRCATAWFDWQLTKLEGAEY